MEEQTIDGLTEDLVLQCLARLHYKDILSASWVCRKWRRFLQTPHFYGIRKQLGYTNQLACFLQHPSPPPDSDLVFKFVINVFDPMSREWNRLPPIPNFINEFYVSIKIASAEGKLVLICDGRGDLATSLFVWDFVTQRWWKGKDFPSIWPFFFAVGFDSQIFIGVYNGNKSISVWAYDMRKDEWTELPQMSQKLSWCHELKVIGDELWVLNGCNTKHIDNEHSAEVYHFQTGKWRLVELDLEQTIDSSNPYCRTTFDFHELLKEFPELKSKFIARISRLQLGAQSLVMVTAFQNNRYGWEEILFMQSYGNFEIVRSISSEDATYVLSSCCVEV